MSKLFINMPTKQEVVTFMGDVAMTQYEERDKQIKESIHQFRNFFEESNSMAKTRKEAWIKERIELALKLLEGDSREAFYSERTIYAVESILRNTAEAIASGLRH